MKSMLKVNEELQRKEEKSNREKEQRTNIIIEMLVIREKKLMVPVINLPIVIYIL